MILSRRITARLFEVLLTAPTSTSDTKRVIRLYNDYLKLHGPRIMVGVWKEINESTYPFCEYLKSVIRRRDDTLDYQVVHQCDLILQFLLKLFGDDLALKG